MTAQTSSNPYETAGRARKVVALLGALDAHQMAPVAEDLEADGWTVVAQRASELQGRTVNPPSAETIAEVLDQIKRRPTVERAALKAVTAKIVMAAEAARAAVRTGHPIDTMRGHQLVRVRPDGSVVDRCHICNEPIADGAGRNSLLLQGRCHDLCLATQERP